MSRLWEDDTPDIDYTKFYTENLKYITVSEFDKEEIPIVYDLVHKIAFNKSGLGLDFTPITVLSNYTFTSRRALIKMPSGKQDVPLIEDNHDGTVSIKYEPREEGSHELVVKYNGEHVQGSPYKFHVDSLSSGSVTAYGPGLAHGVSGEPSHFTISTKGAGGGGLSMAVEGPSKAEITAHDNKDGTVAVSYLPTAPGEYKISVRFGSNHIKGSPFVAKVTGEGRKRNQISVGSCSEVTLPGKISDSDIRSLNASIQAPSGLEEPCFLKRLPSGNIGISFTPREVGEHTVSVKKMGKHITNSPFRINVATQEVGDAKKVQVQGNALKEAKTHVENIFTVDTRSAGYGGLSLSIEGPSKAEINCQDSNNGVLKIGYKPSEPGYYIINLKFADHHVEGSPFTVKVTGEGSNRQREKIQRKREAVPITEVGTQCRLTFKMPGITSFDLASTVTSPGGVSEDAEIQEVEDGLYSVHFVPKELGVHTVSVKYREIHIPGSPFQFTVGPLRDSGAHLVKAGGTGLERGEQKAKNEFNVWTREAGGGSLAISVEGPSKAEIEFKDRRDGSCDVSYKVDEPGEYRIGLKFNEQHIPDSPFRVWISPAVGDAHLLEVAQFPEGLQVDKPAQFYIRLNGAKGDLDARIKSPSGQVDDCFIQNIDGDQYSIRFMPRENGIHNIHVKFNGVHIPASPLRVKVGKDDADPAAVHAHGNGLHEIRTGQKTDLIIDTCNAGAGTLAVTVDGPSRVAMDCTEVEEGYKVRYTPLVPGFYYMSIKYNGAHIVGSPFKIECIGDNLAEEGAQETSSVIVETVQKLAKNGNKAGSVLPHFKSDASKVTSKGMGLKKAYLNKQNQFTVCATDAGNNILYVGVYGPKGPCDEVYVKHKGKNNYECSYLVRDRGEYLVLVKWGDDHIPGSPYKVQGNALKEAKTHVENIFTVDTRSAGYGGLSLSIEGITSFDLASTVTSPGGVSEDAEIQEVEDGLYSVHFVPKELGVHTVSVKYREIHIPGSPFQFTVGPLRDSGAHLVKAGGTGLERGEQKAKNEFNVWTREAGGGSLAISVEGPSKAEIEFKDRRDGSCDVSYKVDEPGEYRIGLKFNEQHIPDSPFRVWISPAVGDAHLLEVAQFPEGLQVDKPAQFYIRLNGAKGDLDARIKSPSGQVDDCFIQNIDGDQYSIRFMPRENGIHNMHVKFNGVHIPASPLRVKVGKDDADPAAVHAHGNGLHEIRTGQKTDLIIDTCNAGAGTLAVTVDGPSRVAMDCTEVEEGYKVRYTPLVPGFYYMSIKYNGAHIVGSPFKIECIGDNLAEEGAQETSSVIVETVQKLAKNGNKAGSVLPHFKSDASKVTSKGMGLKKAYLNKQNQFTVCATDAGNNILYVGVYGPKGPCDEVYVKHKGKNNCECSYLVRDRGEYLVLVKWGDDHIPGSPYKVEL